MLSLFIFVCTSILDVDDEEDPLEACMVGVYHDTVIDSRVDLHIATYFDPANPLEVVFMTVQNAQTWVKVMVLLVVL